MRRIWAAGAVAALLVMMSFDLATAAAHLKGDKPPAPGRWTMKVGPSPTSKTQDGSFVVTKSHRVKKMQINVQSAVTSDCGAKKFTVVGVKKLHKIYSGYSGTDEWVVGKSHAGQTPTYDAIKTSVNGGGKTYKAKIEMSFNSKHDTDTKTYGYVAVSGTPGGICYLDFTFSKA